MYSPYLSRFNGYDPVYGGYTEPLTLHQYLYCLNDPVSYTDPTGEFFSIGGVTAAAAFRGCVSSMQEVLFSSTLLALQSQNETDFLKTYGRQVALGVGIGIGIGIVSNIGADLIDNLFSGGNKSLFDTFNIRPGKGIIKNVASGENGKSYITYTLKEKGKVVYVGRASGLGTPEQVLNYRLGKRGGGRHNYYTDGITAEIVATQKSKEANRGAEEFFMQGYVEQGAELRNYDPALSYGSSYRTNKSVGNIEAFFGELFDR